MNLLRDERFNHQSEVTSGVLEEECGHLLSAFFRQLRDSRKLEKKKKLQEFTNDKD
jgi:tRNA(adenine34) deaminase